MILLTPGPCMTSQSVRAAAAEPDLNHRDPRFLEIFCDLKERLLQIYGEQTRNRTAYLIGGSGTAAVEAMITSCVSGGSVLVVANGYYSRRMADILKAHGMPHEVVELPWDADFSVEVIAEKLVEKSFEAVLMTHQETTLGQLNPIGDVGRLCREHGVKLIVDAMSSFGGDLADFSNCDAVCSSANKCLRGLAGVGFVLATPELASRMREISRRTYYLHLPMYDSESAPLTLPTALMRSFQQALAEFPGVEIRQVENVRKQEWLMQELASRGVNWF